MCRSLLLTTLSLFFAAQLAMAQAPPGTDVYLLQITPTDSGFALTEPRNITDREGYDNQPAFLPDGSGLLYTSIRENQADIYLYDLAKASHQSITKTPESEYSPTPIPGQNAISVVRVEADDRQRLWRFPLDGGEPSLLLAELEPVGYHAWGDERRLALFVLGEPPTLQRVDLGHPAQVVAKNIGRALHKIPGKDAISFIQKEENGWKVQQLDLVGGKISTLAETFPSREDLTWSPDGVLWMGDGNRLAYHCKPCGGWQEVAEFEDLGIHDITRLAIHPNGKVLALVAARGKTNP